jgi:hypothetical protein
VGIYGEVCEATGNGILMTKTIQKRGILGRFIGFFGGKGWFLERGSGKLCKFYGYFWRGNQVYKVGLARNVY